MRSLVAAISLLMTLTGCGALGVVSDAAEPLDAYTLSPLPGGGRGQGSGAHLVVPVPAASGAIATDRILVMPNRLQAEYLPEARWIDPAPTLVQSLVVQSLQNSRAFRLVGRDDAGLLPDATLVLDLTDFQAEPAAVPAGVWTVRVGLVASLVRDEDRSVAATRRFEASVQASGDTNLAVVAAFDAAMREVLGQLVGWTRRTAG
jgi:cholesterol transport system auxiliary component